MEVITIKNSVREINVAEIVKMYSEGLQAGEISRQVHISRRTLESKVAQIKASYKVKTIAQLVAFFLRNGLIQ
jgi:DNA-binding CsgD family transcriptional regulator